MAEGSDSAEMAQGPKVKRLNEFCRGRSRHITEAKTPLTETRTLVGQEARWIRRPKAAPILVFRCTVVMARFLYSAGRGAVKKTECTKAADGGFVHSLHPLFRQESLTGENAHWKLVLATFFLDNSAPGCSVLPLSGSRLISTPSPSPTESASVPIPM